MSSHYNSGCIQCHVVGYDTDPLAVNGGFDDVAASLDPPWTFPDELVPGNWDAMDPKLQNLSNIQCENCHGAGQPARLTALGGPGWLQGLHPRELQLRRLRPVPLRGALPRLPAPVGELEARRRGDRRADLLRGMPPGHRLHRPDEGLDAGQDGILADQLLGLP